MLSTSIDPIQTERSNKASKLMAALSKIYMHLPSVLSHSLGLTKSFCVLYNGSAVLPLDHDNGWLKVVTEERLDALLVSMDDSHIFKGKESVDVASKCLVGFCRCLSSSTWQMTD